METRANGEWKNSFPHREVQLVKRLNLDQPLTDATDSGPGWRKKDKGSGMRRGGKIGQEVHEAIRASGQTPLEIVGGG